MKNFTQRFVQDESGATAIEYGLIAGFVSIAIIVALPTIATELKRIFNAVGAALVTAV